MKRDAGKIALPAAKSAIDVIKKVDPPHVSINHARKIFGPDLSRLIKQGWLDDDIVEALSDQNESDIRRLLNKARYEERRQKRNRANARKKAKSVRLNSEIQKSADLILQYSQKQELGMSPMLAPQRPTTPSLALPAPPADVERGTTLPSDQPRALPPTGAPRPVTRNRGIRRPDEEG